MIDALRRDAASLLSEGKVKLVIGYRIGAMERRVPAFVTDPAKADTLVFDDKCQQNLASYTSKPEIQKLMPLAIVASPTTMRGMAVLAAESQLKPEQVTVLPVDGQTYAGPTPFADAAAELKEQARDERIVKRIAELMALTPAERSEFWQAEFAKCTRCYACRANCPACYCKRCIVEKNVPQWISTAARGHGSYAYHMMRAFHTTGRCASCGACEAACPQGIPLMLLNEFVAQSVAEEFDYQPGDPAAKPFIGTFRPDDDEEFIR